MGSYGGGTQLESKFKDNIESGSLVQATML